MSQALIMYPTNCKPEMLKLLRFFNIVLLLFAAENTTASDSDFWDDDLENRIASVNEGELTFISSKPSQPVHHHHNQITITGNSLSDGWVLLRQCHQNIDPVAALEIHFNAEKIRNIQILSKSNIADAKVNGAIIELQDIEPGAELCLHADSRALHRLNSTTLQLRNGPFMRQFLDGFYPMHVTMEVNWPPDKIGLVSFIPVPAGSGHVKTSTGKVIWEALFEGRLYTKFTFQQKFE